MFFHLNSFPEGPGLELLASWLAWQNQGMAEHSQESSPPIQAVSTALPQPQAQKQRTPH